MPSFSTRRVVPHSAEQMFRLVADIEAYPRFLPLCEGLVLRSRHPGSSGEVLIADMTVGYKAIRETFRSRVELRPAGPTGVPEIMVSYLDGPFRYLDNRWRFLPVESATSRDQSGAPALVKASQSSVVDFHIAYELKTPILALLVGAVFDRAFRKFAEAFETRAQEVYGRCSMTSSAPQA